MSKIKVKNYHNIAFFLGGGEEIGLLSITTKFGLDLYGK